MDLKEARNLVGLSQAALAEKAGVAQQDVSAIERGSRTPTFTQIAKLITALRKAGLAGVTSADIFGTQEEASA